MSSIRLSPALSCSWVAGWRGWVSLAGENVPNHNCWLAKKYVEGGGAQKLRKPLTQYPGAGRKRSCLFGFLYSPWKTQKKLSGREKLSLTCHIRQLSTWEKKIHIWSPISCNRICGNGNFWCMTYIRKSKIMAGIAGAFQIKIEYIVIWRQIYNLISFLKNRYLRLLLLAIYIITSFLRRETLNHSLSATAKASVKSSSRS